MASTFHEEVLVAFGQYLKLELTLGKTSFKARGIEGMLEEGIRTKMFLSDANVLGEPSDTPVPGNVEYGKRH